MCSIYLTNIFKKKKLSLNSSQWEDQLRPYQHYVMGRYGGRPCHHAWLVCLSERHHGDRRPPLHVEQSLLLLDPCLYASTLKALNSLEHLPIVVIWIEKPVHPMHLPLSLNQQLESVLPV